MGVNAVSENTSLFTHPSLVFDFKDGGVVNKASWGWSDYADRKQDAFLHYSVNTLYP